MKITARRVKLLLTLWASKGRCLGLKNCIGSRRVGVFTDYGLPRLADHDTRRILDLGPPISVALECTWRKL